jgi:predicted amidohydrolase YtcJ
MNLFKAYFPPVTGEQYITRFKEFLQMCASKGCTSLHDCSIGNGDPEGDLAVLYTVIREGAPTRYSGYLVST